jgi:hypothetical protein
LIVSSAALFQPLMAFGFYPTVTDIVRIARLYQNAGSYNGRQLLYAPRIRDIFRHKKIEHGRWMKDEISHVLKSPLGIRILLQGEK